MNKHFIYIGLNAIRTFISPFTLFLVSYFIVTRYSEAVWGEFIMDMLLVNLLVHLLQWGNNDYLIREFSKQPAAMNRIFYENLYTRASLLIPACLIILVFQSNLQKTGLLFLWTIGLFIYQSANSLIIYGKQFGVQIWAEITTLIFILIAIWSTNDISATTIVFFFTAAAFLKALIVVIKVFPTPQRIQFNFKSLLITFPFVIIGLSGLLQSRIDQYIVAWFCDEATVGSYQIFLSAFILIQALSAVAIVPYNKIIYRIKIAVFNKIQQRISLFGIGIVVVLTLLINLCLKHLYHLEIASIYLIGGAFFAFPIFIYSPIIYLFYRIGKEKQVMVVNYLGAAFNLIFTTILIFYVNAYSAIIASAIAQWLIAFWYLYKRQSIMKELKKPNL